MKESDSQEGDTVEETPQIPIKTYQWEDVKRARTKGGYPWTHLTKPPFDEEVDAEMYTMDAYRRSRSSSTIDKSEASVPPEKEDVIPMINIENPSGNLEVHIEQTDTDTLDSIELDNTIQECDELEQENDSNFLNASGSRDIHEELDEPVKKRKLSIESSHSRISLSKLAIKDKLKTAKEKLKIPSLLKRSKSDAHESKKPKVQKTENKRKTYYQGTSEPVYIHIPLKPPPGETDEYSKYEFETPPPVSRSASLTHLAHFGSGKRKLSLLGLLTELKRIYDEQVVANESKQEQSLSPETSTQGSKDTLDSKDTIDSEKSTDKKWKKRFKKSKEKKAQEAQELKEMLAATPDSDNITELLEQDDKYEIITTEVPNLEMDCVIITNYDEQPTDDAARSDLNEGPEWDSLNPDEEPRARAKSEEPRRKRKSSIDSSYSRKSLSKLAFIQKIKNAKDSIKLPKFLSFSKSDDKIPKTVSESDIKPKPAKKSELKKESKQPETPLYIHIPLKAPKDEKGEGTSAENKDPNAEETPECETPISPVVSENGVQLIFLTPPSDDEILDVNIPETPSESDQKFFESLRVDELKSIAKKAVDKVYPNYKKLEAVQEDKNEEDAKHGIKTENGTTFWQMQTVLVDEEDGLQLSDAAIALINEEMAKELETNEEPHSTTQIRKKVSFKKARAQDGETIYEDVGLSPDAAKEKLEEPFRSMSKDEEPSYLDEQVIKTTSLDEDYNKWSKITDHEYEPVNPPPEDIKPPLDPPAAKKHASDEHVKHITFSDDLQNEIIAGDHSEAPTTQQFQDNIETRFFKPTKTMPNKTDGTILEDQTQPSKSDRKTPENSPPKTKPGTNFNEAIKMQADKIKTKLQGIKKPHINLPPHPKFPTAAFSKLKFKKPTINVPKMPELPSINFASLTRKNSSKNSWRKRQYSTESNAGDTKTKKFDFGTYPRIFDRSKKVKKKSVDESFEDATDPPVFATVPRAGRAKHAKKESEIKDDEPTEYYYDKTRGFVTIPIDVNGDHPLNLPSHMQYNPDIDIDDGFDEDNAAREPINKSNSAERDFTSTTVNVPQNKLNGDDAELQSDMSSASDHRPGVIEEIDSDQFFLREKGISQDDIDVGKYLSSEIKEAFKNPINALTQLQSEDREYDVDVTDQSQSSEETPKRKWIKKPKRKKTPHVSNEELHFKYSSDQEEYAAKRKAKPAVLIPTRPKRRSKKSKKKKLETQNVVPYQETIPFEEPRTETLDYIDGDDDELVEELHNGSYNLYQNEFDINNEELFRAMPTYINTCDDQIESLPMYINTLTESDVDPNIPPVPPVRKNKSVKSLNAIEADVNDIRDVSEEKSINKPDASETIPEPKTPPSRPLRKRSHTRSESVSSLRDQEQRLFDSPPTRPFRFRSRTRSESIPSMQENIITSSATLPIRPKRIRSQTRSQSTESLPGSRDLGSRANTSEEFTCIEEPCVQVLCDRMGYAIVDKSRIRDPPLPPSRFPKTPPRTRRKKQAEGKFATVPRPPERPLRNYSTLSKGSSISTNKDNLFGDDKENIDINPYMEIDEDELARRLQSGDVIQKMRERPLPAPPRPPRKARSPNREVFRDISHESNLPSDNNSINSKYSERIEFEGDLTDAQLLEMEQQILTDDHEETVTHAALIVQPISTSNLISHSDFFNATKNSPNLNERIIVIEHEDVVLNPEEDVISSEPIELENEFDQDQHTAVQDEKESDIDDDEEMSEIPEDFHKLKNYKNENETRENDDSNIGAQVEDHTTATDAEKEITKELIDDNQRNTFQNDSEECLDESFPHNGTEEIEHTQVNEDEDSDFDINETELPPVPPRSDSVGNLVEDADLNPSLTTELTNPQDVEESNTQASDFEKTESVPPVRPPRKFSQTEKQISEVHFSNRISDVVEETTQTAEHQFTELRPRPNTSGADNFTNTPHTSSLDSQPPLSFYNLRPGSFHESNIPLVMQCRQCGQKLTSHSRSSSAEDLPSRCERVRRLSEASIPHLTGQLVQSCATEADRSLRNFATYLADNVIGSSEGKQDLQVLLLMLVILIASLILMGNDGKIEHIHHWEYFNPPREF